MVVAVIIAYSKTNVCPGLERILASDVFPPLLAARDRLVDPGFAQEHLAASNQEPKIALSVDLYFVCALKIQFDNLWINTWINQEDIFQLSLRSVIDHADAGAHLLVAHPSVSGNVGPPLFRIIANKIIRLAQKLRRTLNPMRMMSPANTHPHPRTRRY